MLTALVLCGVGAGLSATAAVAVDELPPTAPPALPAPPFVAGSPLPQFKLTEKPEPERISQLYAWRRQLESRLENLPREEMGDRGILGIRMGMSLALTYLELAYWKVDSGTIEIVESPYLLVRWADDLMSEIDVDLLNDADKRVVRILDQMHRYVFQRQLERLDESMQNLLAANPGLNPPASLQPPTLKARPSVPQQGTSIRQRHACRIVQRIQAAR